MSANIDLGTWLAGELQRRHWTAGDFAAEIENVRGRELDGKLIRDLQIRQLEIELTIHCSADKSCKSSDESLRSYAKALGTDWRFLRDIQDDHHGVMSPERIIMRGLA